MTEGGSSRKKKGVAQNQDHGFAELIFSWSLDDIRNEKLYEHQVEKIPLTFQSEEHYFRSFVYPLLEETRTELASCMKMMYRAPFAEISSFRKAKGKKKLMYDVTVGNWRNSERRKEPYRTLPGDLLILTNGEPGSVSDLKSLGSRCTFLLVTYTDDDNSGYDGTPVQFKVTASQNIEFHDGMFAVFLMNITTQKRIWSSLHKHANLDIIKEILYTDSVVKEKGDMCSLGCNSPVKRFDSKLVSKLNESQKAAIMAAIGKAECCHKSSVEQIWGPPGTGKTMTVSVMLSIFLQMNYRTLTCAPTNVAIVAVASRVLSLVKESSKTITASGDSFCSIGDFLLFGNKERLKVGTNIEEIYLDHRVEKLIECLGSLTGWKHCIKSMIDLLEDCVSQYHVFVENELLKEEELTNEKKSKTKNMKVKSFMEFVRERFSSFVLPLRRCIITFCTHIPRSFMKQENFQAMVSLLDNLSSLQSLLSQKNLVSEELEKLFVSKPLQDSFVNSGHMSSINSVRIMSLSLLKTLQTSLGRLKLPGGNKDTIKRFCYERASLIFCTTSTSYTLQKFKMEPLKLLVIDEAAQMKESEAIIPLQIPGMRHAILIGDECQLPATVKSHVSSECGLGRSLFERLSSLGHSKHLLNVQYRMHPRISSFPNLKFYHNQILDAKNVKCKSYGRQYLSGEMFGPYSFINIVGGREEGDDAGSKRNMVEVSIVINIVQKLYKAWKQSKKKVSIGVVSPYAAQVVSIEEKLRYKYEKRDGFSVTVKSIDGFQGGEEDIIILSTVRSNDHGSVGFISSPQRTNVALTRARHCLWILGNERTLARSDSIWKDLVLDARNRGCLFNADSDECLKKIIIDAKTELEPLNDMVKGNSLLLKHVKWKVLFSDNFRKSFGKLMDSRMKNLVIDFLQKLSGGWRPSDGNIDCKTSSKVLKTYEVEGLHVIWTTDIIKEFKYIQVLKVWDILPLKDIPKLRKELESILGAYTDDYMNRCTTKHLEGNLEIPKSWVASQEIIQFRNVTNCEVVKEVSESLLHMKFYSLSPGMVNHLRFGRDIDLPMQLSEEQMDIFLCSKSSFIFGRLGTGKTTILMMKLLQKEQSFRDASKGAYETESSQDMDAKVVDDHEVNKPTFLRQLFVTVSPKSCHVVKQHVSHLTSISCDGNPSVEVNLDDSDVTSDFNLHDTFIDIPEKSYPLVITFQKFLMMLDGTLGNSFFERFHEAREGSHGNHTSSRSFALETFIRSRNVTFDRFCSAYWPHFDSNLTKKLDPSRVFSEITFHIKGGGLQAEERSDGKLNYEGYSLLSEGHTSTLTKQKRETVDTIFEAYEKMKAERAEFDLGDLVNDLHHRLKTRSYEGDQMDFIYIDEVQDLSMKQISLFKYICQNVDEGFVFAGDTTQTIARGVDFRFQDMKSMFYTEFVGSTATGKQEKGCLPEIFQLIQNSRTHGRVLKLAQSVIDILYCYFAHSIGILEPETSLISGEAPVLLKSGNDKNAIMTIFGGPGTSKDNVGFSAEQVILVRDDYAKTEVCKYVGKQALVLTIAECKGLEFQDVLLYNFFGSSPLKDQWSVIYGYMKEQDWLDEKLHPSFPSFKESRHNVLCSELKQLYVAITCTRQRLWICENKEELSKPMFDYWKKRGLIQVRKLNDSVARAMRRASSPQEWLERGKKLFYENIFVMATMCFERAGDSMWETMAKAFGLKTYADQMRETNPEGASCYLKEAAEMLESLGKFEEAATCYFDSGEHERAGKLYLDKCGQIDVAAECFRLAGCYSDAAEAYAKGNQFSNCLSLCIQVELFDKGLKHIRYWKDHFHVRNKEQEQIEQEFLETCALRYYERKDPKSMMKFVRAFCSMESKRLFLRSLGCLDNLMLLEEESGHFLDAAELAGSTGDVLKEADLFEKAGCCEEATLLILWYVFFNSLWGNENTGWPLKQFSQKNVLCKKAKSLAKKHSNDLHGIVCNEIKVLSHQQCCLSMLKKQLHTSHGYNSLRSELILIRKILDAHFQLEILTYDWDHKLPIDINEYVEDKISQNCVSVRTLVFYFNLWKDNVMDIFQTLKSLDDADPNQHEGHVDFTLNYFGVRKQCVKGKIIYLLVNKDMSWVRNGGDHRESEILSLDGKQLVCAMRSYWQSELLSVGLKVLETIQMLSNLTSKSSAFHQSTSLLYMFEVSKFLLDCEYLDLTFQHTNSLQDFLEISMTYFNFVIPLDWRRSICRNLIALRETDLSLNLLEEVILQYLNIEIDFTYWTIGRVMMLMICLSSKKSIAVYEKIILGLEWNDLWKSFAEKFWEDDFNDVYVAPALHNAMEETYRVDCWLPGFMSPHSFVYLLDRLLFMTSFSSGFFFTTKSSFVEWYASTPDTTFTASKQIFSRDIADFLVKTVQDILYKKEETISWIEQSYIVASYYHPLIALKLLMIVSLVSLQFLDCSQLLIDLLLGSNNVAYLLPQKFVGDLLRRKDGSNLNLSPDMVAEAFKSIEDPLLIVNSENENPRVHAPCAIFLDLKRPTEEIMSTLFSRKSTRSRQKDKAPKTENRIEKIDDEHNNDDHSPVELEVEKQSCNDNTQDSGSKIRIESNRRKKSNTNNTLATVLLDGQPCVREDATPHETNNSSDYLKHPSFASDVSELEVEFSVSTCGKMEETDHEHNNDYQSPSNLVLEKESINKNTPDVEIKKRRKRTRRKSSKKDKGSLNTFATVLVDGQQCAGEDTTLQEINIACNDLQQPSSASDTSFIRPEVDFEVSRSDDTTMPTFVERGQSSREMVDCFLTQEWKGKQKVGLDCSDMTEALYEENHVEETGDEQSDGDHSSVKLEVEKQNSNNNTQDSGIKTGMGNRRRRRSKKNKDSNTQNTLATVLLEKQPCAIEDTTLQEASNSWVDGSSSQSAIGQKGKVKNKGRWIKKNKGSNGVNTFTGIKHSNVHLPVKLVLKKQTRNEKTKDVETKKGKGKNIDKQIKKNKCSNNVNTSNGDKNSNDHSADARIKSNETTKDVEVKKGKGKNKEKGIKKNKGSNSVNKFTGNQQSHIHLPVKLVLKKQTRIGKTKDVEIKKGKGKNMDKQINKHKGNNSVNTSNGDKNSNDHPQMELMLEGKTSNKNTKCVEIKKGKGKTMEKWIKKSTGSNSFTGDEHSKDHPPVEIKLQNQTSNKNTHDAEIKKGKSKKEKVSNSLNPFTTVLVDEKHCSGEATTSGGSNSTCKEKDLKQSSSASDKSNKTEALQEEIHVEEIKVEANIGDHSPQDLLLEKQNNNAETKNGKGKIVSGEDATMCKENSICNDQELPSSVFDIRKKALDAVKYGSINLCKAAAFLGIRSWRET